MTLCRSSTLFHFGSYSEQLWSSAVFQGPAACVWSDQARPGRFATVCVSEISGSNFSSMSPCDIRQREIPGSKVMGVRYMLSFEGRLSFNADYLPLGGLATPLS
jgi:hypothetical protein